MRTKTLKLSHYGLFAISCRADSCLRRNDGVFNWLTHYKNKLNLEYIIFYSFIDSIRNERESIDKLFCFMREIDAAISVASLKAGNPIVCTPYFSDNS